MIISTTSTERQETDQDKKTFKKYVVSRLKVVGICPENSRFTLILASLNCFHHRHLAMSALLPGALTNNNLSSSIKSNSRSGDINGYSCDPPTVCAGCGRTGLPLLVCDDCNTSSTNSGVSPNDWNQRYVIVSLFSLVHLIRHHEVFPNYSISESFFSVNI